MSEEVDSIAADNSSRASRGLVNANAICSVCLPR